MPIDVMRDGPAGSILIPAPPVGTIWSPITAQSLVLEALPEGHAPGLYSFSIALMMLTVGVGTTTIGASWSQPGVGATSVLFSGNAPFNTVASFIAPRHIMSTGELPIIFTLTPAGVSGAPRALVNMPMDLIMGRFPEGFPS